MLNIPIFKDYWVGKVANRGPGVGPGPGLIPTRRAQVGHLLQRAVSICSCMMVPISFLWIFGTCRPPPGC